VEVSRVTPDETVFGGTGVQRVRGMSSWASGLAAVGEDLTDGDGDGAVWLSPDGASWARVAHDETLFGGPGAQTIEAAAASKTLLVAVGRDESSGDGSAAIWTTADGIGWSRVPHDETVFGGPGFQGMETVAVWTGGFVATGTDRSSGAADVVVWLSTDGLTWSRVPHQEALGGAGNQGIVDVIEWAGGLIGVGWEDAGDADAAVWISLDGLDWSRVVENEAVFGGPGVQVMGSIVEWPGGLLAVGATGSDAGVWTSANGVTWTLLGAQDALGGGGLQALTGVTVLNDRLVAVGRSDHPADEPDAGVWVSDDGVTWWRVPHDEDLFGGGGWQAMWSVAGFEDLLVAGWIIEVPPLEP
jgi:hypothetical protein